MPSTTKRSTRIDRVGNGNGNGEGAMPSVRAWGESSSWKYAFAVILDEFVRPHRSYQQWDNIRANFDRCREYRKLYFKMLNDETTNDEKRRVEVGGDERSSFSTRRVLVDVLGAGETTRSAQFGFHPSQCRTGGEEENDRTKTRIALDSLLGLVDARAAAGQFR